LQAEDFYDSVRPGLMAMLPRLKRFADVLVGSRSDATSLLGRALNRMLDEQHRYQRGTALEVWAFGEIYRHWLRELRDHANPMSQAKTDDASFERLFDRGGVCDRITVGFLRNLPPQQRLTLLLVYGEGFSHADAARVLDVAADTITSRLIRVSATLADRLSLPAQAKASATIETLYPEGNGGSP
jgi:DNA-directed RNA polymerase specialized sigma24 family protein